MKKVLALGLVIALTMGTCIGCTSDTGSSSSSTTTTTSGETEDGSEAFDGTIYWLNYKPEVSEGMQVIAEAYTAETGIDVKIETAASGTYESTLTVEMDKTDSPTIFVVDNLQMLSRWKDYTRELSDTELYSMMSDTSYVAADEDGIFGISYALESYGIIVNESILNDYFALDTKNTDVTTVEELYEFENLKAVVEDMQANKDALGIQGVFGSTSLQTGDAWRYTTHLFNQPIYWELGADADLSGDIPEFTFEYEDYFKNIFDLYINNSITEPTLVGSKTVDESMAEFALGQVAMIQNGDWAWSTIEGTDGAVANADNVLFIPITMGVDGEESLGLCTGAGQYMCINSTKSDAEQEAALEFLTWLFSSETGTQLVAEELQFVTPFSTMADAEYNNPLFASANEIAASGQVAYPWVMTLIPSEDFKNSLGSDLLLYAQGQLEWDTLVQNTVDNWAYERELANNTN
ncbi:MAG: ABC transporter substrate-binding protein [Eubacteriales bacterium]